MRIKYTFKILIGLFIILYGQFSYAQQVDVQWSRYLGGSRDELYLRNENTTFGIRNENLDYQFENLVHDGVVYSMGVTKSGDYPVTDGHSTQDSSFNFVITAISPDNGNIKWSRSLFSHNIPENYYMDYAYEFFENHLYLLCSYAQENEVFGKIISINLVNGSIEYEQLTNLIFSFRNSVPSITVDKENIYFAHSSMYGTTDNFMAFVVFDRSTGKRKKTYKTKQTGNDFATNKCLIDNDFIYYFTQNVYSAEPALLLKFDKKNLQMVDSIQLVFNDGNSSLGDRNHFFMYQTKNQIIVRTISYNFPYLLVVDKKTLAVTKSTFPTYSINPRVIFDIHSDTMVSLSLTNPNYGIGVISATLSDFQYDSIYKSMTLGNADKSNVTRFLDSKVRNNKLIFLNASNYFVPEGNNSIDVSTVNGNSDLCFLIFDLLTGKHCYKAYIGGSGIDRPIAFSVLSAADGCYDIIVKGLSNSDDFPASINQRKGGYDYVISRIKIRPDFDTTNFIQPLSQQSCTGGYIETLVGNAVKNNGCAVPQYLWQESSISADGPWININQAVKPNYLPKNNQAGDRYYRRLVINRCSGDTVSISNVSHVTISQDVAPVVDVGKNLLTCPGVAVTLGNNPLASGGTGVLNYTWDYGQYLNNPALPNPSANVNESTLFTVTVSDALGCKQIGQVLVKTSKADAGDDFSFCADQPTSVLIGKPSAIDGLTYSWSPAALVSCAECPQTLSSAINSGDRILTQTVQLADGGTCSTKDTMRIIAIPPPKPNFAGDDIIQCYSGSNEFTIGTPADAGYAYQWIPNTYLIEVNNSIATIKMGSSWHTWFYKNPLTYVLQAKNQGCSRSDTMSVVLVNGQISNDGCGPRSLGTVGTDNPPGTSYQWSVVSGPDHIIGPRDQATTYVGESDPETTVYRRTTRYKDVVCTDDVSVGPCGCNLDIKWSGSSDCPSKSDETNTFLRLTAEGKIGGLADEDLVFTWSPCEGLDTCRGHTVLVLDTVHRTYTVTLTSSKSNLICIDTIEVNNPNFLPPYFNIGGHCFFGDTLHLGLPPEPDLTYSWYSTPSGHIEDNKKHQSIQVINLTDYPVKYSVVVQNTVNGCINRLSKVIQRSQPNINLADTVQACVGSIVSLGDNDADQWFYQWSPANAPWQNGTGATSHNPEVLVATDVQYRVAITDTTSMCTKHDTVTIRVTDSPQLQKAENVFVCPGDSVQIGVAPVGNVVYEWSPADGLSCTDCPQPMASPSTATTYVLRAALADLCGGYFIDSVRVTLLPEPVFELEDLYTCPSVDIDYNPTNAECAGCIYQWGNNSNTSDKPRVIIGVGYEDGILWMKTTNQLGCSYIDTMQIIIAKSKLLDYELVLCKGDQIQLHNDGNMSEYTWYPSDHLSCDQCLSPVFAGNSSGNYTIYSEGRVDVNGKVCTVIDSVRIRVIDPNPSMALDTIACKATCITIGPYEADPAILYQWLPADGLSCSNCPNPTVCPDVTSEYTLIATPLSEVGCVGEAKVRIEVKDVPVPDLHVDDITLCEGEIINLAAQISPVGNYNYEWKPVGALNNPYLASPIFNSGQAGSGTYSYTLQLTDLETGCSGVRDTFNVTVVNEDAYINLSPSQHINCESDTIIVYSTLSKDIDNTTMQWISNGDGHFIYTSPDSAIYVLGQAEFEGKYFNISASAQTKLCRDSTDREYFDLYQGICCPQACLNLRSDTFCNAADHLISFRDSMCYRSYGGQWYLTSGPDVSSEQILIDDRFNPQGRMEGVYLFTYKFDKQLNECNKEITAPIFIVNSPYAGTATKSLNTCSHIDSTAYLADLLTGADGNGYWSGSGLPQGSLNTESGQLNLKEVSAGDYTANYIVLGGNGCPNDTAAVHISLRPSPTAFAGPDAEIGCNASLALLGSPQNSPQGAGITWTSVEGNSISDPTSGELFVDQIGSYIVTLERDGCIDTDTVQVREGAPPIDQVMGSSVGNICHSDNKGEISITDIDGGTAPFTYTLTGPVDKENKSGRFDGLPPGDYRVQITDANGCITYRDYTVDNPPPIQLDIKGDTLIHCQDTIVLSVVTDLDASEIDRIQWFAGQKLIEGASGLIENLTDHKSAYYLVRLKNKSGCEIETRVNIKYDNQIPYYAPNVFSPNYDGINDEFKLYFDDRVYSVKSFRVFDRWGALMCEQHDIDPHSAHFGWDGSHRGKPMDPGVYVWMAEVTGCDGRQLLLKGDVTIVK